MYTDFVFGTVPATELTLAAKRFRTQYVVMQTFATPAACRTWKEQHPHDLVCHVVSKPDAREVNSFKGVANLIAIKGGSLSLNHFAVSTKGIDVLIQSYVGGDAAILDANMVNTAKENRVALLFLMSDLLHTKNVSALLKYYRQAALICGKKKASFFLVTGATTAQELRNPHDLSALSSLLGQSPATGIKWVRNLTSFIEKKQKKSVELI